MSMNLPVGAAGGAQVTAVYFQQATGTRFGFVPYRGGAPAMQDLIAGQVDIMFDQAANAIGQVRNGTIKSYAVLTKDRWSALPEVPSIDDGVSEAGQRFAELGRAKRIRPHLAAIASGAFMHRDADQYAALVAHPAVRHRRTLIPTELVSSK